MLSLSERSKLVRILGLLGSDFDGERAAAGLLATRMLRRLGLGWDALIALQPPPAKPRPQPAPQPPPEAATGWREDLALCRRHLPRLTEWECKFVASLSERRASITPKQLEKLSQIAGKLRRA